LAGTGFCFISHRGIVQPCGFLDVSCGDITRESFADIWNHSDIFLSLRNFGALKGKCGECEFKNVWGGCRAGTFEATGDFPAEEPLCSYQPRSFRKEERGIRK
jgi:AdoMet-dependent heme synthase